MYKVFIDGSAGTTGLKIYDRLSKRNDVSLIKLPDELRKDASARKQAINESDVCFLCLPDDAAKESVSFVENDHTIVIDTSTAHRTSDKFAYGFAELKGYREAIKNSKKIANPGCHASGFISLVEPLISSGVLKSDIKLSCFSLTGYSGGGKKMIAEYEDACRPAYFDAPRLYALSQSHKHLPEIQKVCKLDYAPTFMPVVADYIAGMQVIVPLFTSDLKCSVNDIKEIYKELYNSKIVYYTEETENGFSTSNSLAGRDDMQISVFGNDQRITLVSRFDNLGKGASGAAIQNMNVALGIDETLSLILND